MTQSFSLFTPRASRLHSLHPLTKLSSAGFLLVAGLLLPGPWAGFAAFALAVVPLAFWAGVPRELIAGTFRLTLPFALSVYLVQGLFWTGGTPVLSVGPLSVKGEGLWFATTSTGRILMVVGSFMLFALTTRPDTLMTALSQRGLPGSIAYIVVGTIQIVPRFQAKAAAILDAQRARGLETEGGFMQRLRSVVPLVAPLVLGSLVDVEERAMAIEARAFNRVGAKTSLVPISERRWEPVVRWALGIAVLFLIAWRIRSALET